MNELNIRYFNAKKNLRNSLYDMKNSKKRKNLEVEAAYLICKIEKYNSKKNLIEYVVREIEGLEKMAEKY